MNPPTGIPALSPRDAAAAVDTDGALIVDVRERDEFVAERAPGVALVPLSEFVARHEELPKDRPLLMVCAAGSRSASATMYLLEPQFADLRLRRRLDRCPERDRRDDGLGGIRTADQGRSTGRRRGRDPGLRRSTPPGALIPKDSGGPTD